jgi:hypothetical protein
MLKKALVAGGALVAIAVVAVGVVIGPRNVIGMMRYDIRREGDVKVGDRALDVTLRALDGAPVHLAERLRARPTVLIFGSFT